MTKNIPPELKEISVYHQYDEEVTLAELWNTLVKRKFVLLAVFLLVTVPVLLFILVDKPIFESRVVINVGHIGKIGSLEIPEVLIQRIMEEYKVNDLSEGSQNFPLINDVRFKKDLKNLITITAHGYNAWDAQNFLKTVSQKIVDTHQGLYNEIIQERERIVKLLNQRISQTKMQIIDLSEKIETVIRTEVSLAAVLTQEKAKLLIGLTQLEQKRSDIRLSMAPLISSPTAIMRAPTLPISSIHPKPILYLSMATILGLLIGIVIVFIINFFESVRDQAKLLKNQTN